MSASSLRQTARSNKVIVVGLLVISAIVLISFFPSIKVGFLGDDWDDIAKAARMPFADYARLYLDPTLQFRWYRPVYGAVVLTEYHVFGANPEGYHIVQIALHLINCILLCAVIVRLTRRVRLALLSSILYATLPVYGSAIFWVAVHDPLAMVFNLGAILWWVIYLQTKNKPYFWLAFVTASVALVAKESNVFLPITLFLIDRWFLADQSDLKSLVRRYTPLGIALIVYGFIEYLVQTHSYLTNVWGYGVGVQMIQNTLHYLALLVLPWGIDEPVNYAVLTIVLATLIYLTITRHSKWLLFLAIETVLAILPVTGFPTMFFFARYVYAAAMVSGILLAVLIDIAWQKLTPQRQRALIISSFVMLLLWVSSTLTGQAADAAAEAGRQARVPFRDISQQHPSYPADTYLYFVEPPYPMILRNLMGMFYLRYGPAVTVWSTDAETGGIDKNRFAQLRSYPNTFVYYFDDEKRRHEVAVERSAESSSTPPLPAQFQAGIRLEGFEVTSTTLNRGQDWVLLLYWQATQSIEKDYTVFVHWVNENGEMVFGEDTQPRGNRAPTSGWYPNKLIVDAHILTVPPDVPSGKYHLEVGLYYLPTLQRLQIIDARSNPVSDQVLIEQFTVVN